MCKVTVKVNTVMLYNSTAISLCIQYTVIADLLLVAKKRCTLMGNHTEGGRSLQVEV